jgi:hypothetical protein
MSIQKEAAIKLYEPKQHQTHIPLHREKSECILDDSCVDLVWKLTSDVRIGSGFEV